MGKLVNLTDEQIAKALRKHHGLIRNVARELKCAHTTIYSRISKSDELRKVWNEARAGLVDMAESALVSKIQEGDTKAILFVLQTLGKDRGWELRTNAVIDMGVKILLEAKEAAVRAKAISKAPEDYQEAEIVDDSDE